MTSVREWDPFAAPDDEMVAWHRVEVGAAAVDRPDDPTMTLEGLRGWLRTRTQNRRRRHLVAERDGRIVGTARLALPTLDNTHLADLALVVDPAARRTGVGTALLREVVRICVEEGRRTLTGEVVEGTAGEPFAQARGFTCAQRDPRSLLRFADLDLPRIRALAAAPHPGYVLHTWVDTIPAEWLAPYAAANAAMNDAPTGDLDVGPDTYTADTIADLLAAQVARGHRFHVVVAVHEATGEVAGLTELVRTASLPTRAEQGDTCVVPAHRGNGLGLWVKAAMLLRFLAEEPGVLDVQTWNAETNAHMLAVNDALGYRRDHVSAEYQAAVPVLAAALRPVADGATPSPLDGGTRASRG